MVRPLLAAPALLLVFFARCTGGGAAPAPAPADPAQCCVGNGQFALCDVCPDVDCGVQQATTCPAYTFGCEDGSAWTSAPDYSACPADAGDASAADAPGG